ncbi:MAG: hypothetical protein IJ646_13860, partial [Clostridia bacterium]|nr:hypothetical protein [Clostridia bacterium]
MAGQVDKGQLRPDAAKTLCALTATEAGSLAERLRIVSGGAGDGLCAALTERLAALADQLAAVSDTAQTAPANIAGMLRAAQIDDVIGLVEMREEMLKTG